MAKFTRENPFEFEGGRIPVILWPLSDNGLSDLRCAFKHYPATEFNVDRDVAAAVMAFRAQDSLDAYKPEAEAHPAEWTEQGEGTWRKGRVTVVDGGSSGVAGREIWGIYHSDLGMEGSWCQATFRKDGTDLDELTIFQSDLFLTHITDFLAHLAAQKSEPEFTPLPVPEVGQWIRAELRDGTVVEGEVAHAIKNANLVRIRFIGSRGWGLFINLTEEMESSQAIASDILAWSPIDPPVPDEPTGLGAVVRDDQENIWTRADRGTLPWFLTRKDGNGGATTWAHWSDVLRFGPVTVESPGVEL